MKKQTHLLNAAHHAHLSKIGIPWLRPPYIRATEEEYQQALEMWRQTKPKASEEWLHMKALGHVAWAQHQKEARDVQQEMPAPIDRRFPLWLIAALLLVLALLFFAPLAHCQFSKIMTIQVQQGGSTVGFHASPFNLNFSGCTVSNSGSTDTVTCNTGSVTNNPGGSNNQLQFNSGGTAFGGIASAGLGKVLIDQGAGNLPAFADPLVQGTQAAGSTTLPNPVVQGGQDYSGTPTVRTWKVDSNGYGYVVFGTPQHVILDSGTVSLPSNAAQETGGNLAIIAGIVSSSKAAVKMADGDLVTLGAKTDAKSTATDATSVSVMQVLKEMSAMLQAPASTPVTAASLPLPSNAAQETGGNLAAIKTDVDKIPSSPSTDRTTAAAPFSTELSDGAAFYVAAKTGQLPTTLDGSGFLKTHEQGTAAVSAASLPLPSNAAQETGGNLATIATNTSNPGCAGASIANTQTFAINNSTSGNTQILALSSGKVIYVCSYLIQVGSTNTAKLVYGTGSACATGQTDITGPIGGAAQSGGSLGNGVGVLGKSAASNALCINNSAASQVSGSVTVAQF